MYEQKEVWPVIRRTREGASREPSVAPRIVRGRSLERGDGRANKVASVFGHRTAKLAWFEVDFGKAIVCGSQWLGGKGVGAATAFSRATSLHLIKWMSWVDTT